MEAARRLDEWKVLARKVPDVDHVPVLKPRDMGEPVTLSPPEWNLVIRIDGRKSVEELSRATSSNSFDTAKILYGLVTGDLVDMRPARRAREGGRPGGRAVHGVASAAAPPPPPPAAAASGRRPARPARAHPAALAAEQRARRREKDPHDPVHARQAGGGGRDRRGEPARHRPPLQAGASPRSTAAAASKPSAT